MIFFSLLLISLQNHGFRCKVRRSHHLFHLSALGGDDCIWSDAADTTPFMCTFSALDWANLGWKWLCWDQLAWLPLLGLLELEWKEKLNLHYELGLRSHMITGCHLPLLFDQPDKFGCFFFCHFNEAKEAESKLTYTSKVVTVHATR